MLHYKRTWTLFDDFLVPSLDRAFSLAEVYSVALSIAEHLHLDMMAVRIIPLNEHASVLEQIFAPRFDSGKRFPDFLNVLSDRQTHSTATCSGFEHHGEP